MEKGNHDGPFGLHGRFLGILLTEWKIKFQQGSFKVSSLRLQLQNRNTHLNEIIITWKHLSEE